MAGRNPERERKRANVGEVAAVVATACLHLLLSTVLEQQGLFIALALVGWTSYGVWQFHRDADVLGRWGLSRAGLAPALVATSVVALSAAAAMAWVGEAHGTLRLDGRLLPLFLLYPAWGLLQQLLVQALVARNLRRAGGWVGSTLFVVPTCAILFGLVHLPDARLAGATFLLGLVFTPIYLRWRNLWPLGLYHGWLGALFYVWVLDRDPWREIAG